MAMYAEKLMNFALSQVGTKEKPAGSNRVKYNKWFYGENVSGASYPWCCAFVCYCFNHVGFGNLFYGGKKTASCANFQEYAESKKLTVSKDAGRYGDVVTFHFGGGRTRHIGLIIKKNADGSYQTVEGNTSTSSDDNGGSVMIRTRYKSQIAAIIRPKYTQHKLVEIIGTCRKFKSKDITSKALAKLTEGDKVRFVKDCKDGWSEVISVSDGEVGYVKNKYLEAKLSGYKTAILKANSNIKQKNSATSKTIDKCRLDASVRVITKRKVWTNVIWYGKTGWVKTKNIKF